MVVSIAAGNNHKKSERIVMWFVQLQDQNFSIVDIQFFTEWYAIINFFGSPHDCHSFQINELQSKFHSKKFIQKLEKFSHNELEDFIVENTKLICVTKNYSKLIKAGDLCKFSTKYGIRFVARTDDPSSEFVISKELGKSIITIVSEPQINLKNYSTTWSVVGFIPEIGTCYIDCQDIDPIPRDE